MKFGKERMAGVLMPVASLPGKGGAGTFGREAYRFVDILAKMGMKIWQLLPLNPMGYGNSPYQPFSSFAGDELYIDLDLLEAEGLLTGERETYVPGKQGRIDFQKVRAYKEPYLRQAYRNFRECRWEEEEFVSFQKQEWVYPYAVYMALKKQNGLRCWNLWPKEQQDWILDGKYDLSPLEEEIGFQLFLQYTFYRQWLALKTYANERGILIMGDMPFYVGTDSSDVWCSREDFLLQENGEPAFVAGVPPDYFSKTGQRWGNPIYNWENLERKGFSFWLNRLGYNAKLYDIIRIDHFRAFDTYWKVPSSCPTAVEGCWMEAPGYALFEEVYRQMPDIRIVAEDLGDLRPEVLELRDHFDLIGMHVAEYAIPHSDHTEEHILIYTGTHDNQTVKEWYDSMPPSQKKKTRTMLAKYSRPGESIPTKMLRFVFSSRCVLAVVPAADILGLGEEARLNLPGTVGSPNWEWQLQNFQSLRRKISFVRELLQNSNRA